jgi:hypothetical protein
MGVFDAIPPKSPALDSRYPSTAGAAISHNLLENFFSFSGFPPIYRLFLIFYFYNPSSSDIAHRISQAQPRLKL